MKTISFTAHRSIKKLDGSGQMSAQMGLQLAVKQKLQLKMTPELRQSIQLLQYSTTELQQFFQEQLAENPLLEVNHPSEYIGDSSSSSTDKIEQTVVSPDTWIQQLEAQLSDFELNKQQIQVCLYLIGNLDEKGYLQVEQVEVCEKFQLREQQWLTCLQVIHQLEPAGIGARDFAECLEIQLKHKAADSLTFFIAQQYLHQVADQQWEYIATQLQVGVEQVLQSVEIIKGCSPYPFYNHSLTPTQYITPDVTVSLQRGEIKIQYHEQYLPSISIHSSYQQMYHTDRKKYHMFTPWLKSASLLIKGMEQRQHTICQVSAAIMEHQFAFLESGIRHVVPLTLQQIADRCELHESTVSRATKNKYMQTPHGLFPFRFFFPAGVQTVDGEKYSVRQIKNKMKKMIQEEDAAIPLSDQEIANQLQQKGILISRRTVSKYRQEMRIASSQQRKKRRLKINVQ